MEYVRGSFNWYRYKSGDFVVNLTQAIMKADNDNLKRLHKAFPQMVAAHACNSWDEVPAGFEPRYNAEFSKELLQQQRVENKSW